MGDMFEFNEWWWMGIEIFPVFPDENTARIYVQDENGDEIEVDWKHDQE